MHAYLIFGDSITHGRGENPSQGWVGRFKKDFEARQYYNVVYNLGIPGDNSTQLCNRVRVECEARIQKHRPEDQFHIVIAIGLNDSKVIQDKPLTTLEKFSENITQIIHIAKKHTQRVTIISLTPVVQSKTQNYESTQFTNERVKKYNEVLTQIATDTNCTFIDVLSPLLKMQYDKLLDDGLHPNSEGYDAIYTILRDQL